MIQALRYLRTTSRNVRVFAWAVGLTSFLLSARAGLSQNAPELTTIARTSVSPLSAGSNLTYTFSVTPGANSIISIGIDVVDQNGYDYLIGGNLVAGNITFQTSAYWVNGSYTVADINIYDGTRTEYNSNGTITNSGGETIVGTNPLTSALNFTVTGGADSITGPAVTAFTAPESNPFRAIGSTLVFDLGLNPGTRNEVTAVDLLLQDPHGGQENIEASGNLTGPLVSFPLSGLTVTGAYTVLGLSISDGYGDETFSGEFGASAIHETPGAYNINFSSLGFTVTPAPDDINHDGKPDIFWMNTSTGVCGAYLMNGTSVTDGLPWGTCRRNGESPPWPISRATARTTSSGRIRPPGNADSI